MASTCQCAGSCGDDPEVQAGRVRGCATFRARRNPDHLGAQVDALRAVVKNLIGLMDRLEPDVADDVREAAEVEWDGLKTEAKRVLGQTE